MVLDLVAWAGHLAVAILLLILPERNPLLWPMRLLAFALFVWNLKFHGSNQSNRDWCERCNVGHECHECSG